MKRHSPERRRVEYDRRQVKASGQFIAPLLAKSRRTEHEDMGVGATCECFRDDQACLHRFPETHLVCNQNSCGQSVDEGERRLELIGKDGDVGCRRCT